MVGSECWSMTYMLVHNEGRRESVPSYAQQSFRASFYLTSVMDKRKIKYKTNLLVCAKETLGVTVHGGSTFGVVTYFVLQ